MEKLTVIILAAVLSINLAGCGNKQSSSKDIIPEAMSIEELSKVEVGVESKGKTDTAVNNASQAVISPVQDAPAPEGKLASLPPSGPYKPSIKNIQSALKNAGCYTGKIDGKSGPATKQAIENFQKTNELKVDGKVGPKTWEVLSKYLNLEPAIEQTETVVKKNKS